MVNWKDQGLALLTDLEDAGDRPLVQEAHALAVGGVLVLEGEAAPGPGAGAAVHPDVALVPGEGPVDQPLLHWLGDAGEALLHPLEGDCPRHQLGGDVQERAGVVSPGQRSESVSWGGLHWKSCVDAKTRSRSQTKICQRQLRCQKLIFLRKDASLRFYCKLLCGSEITPVAEDWHDTDDLCSLQLP